MEVAIMFTLYETAGVVTNLLAGIAGAKWGIKFTLLFGLSFQFVGLGMLYGWNPAWEKSTAIIYVTIAQMMSGISKDLTKLGGKTVTKLVTPDEKQGQLFKLVSWYGSITSMTFFPCRHSFNPLLSKLHLHARPSRRALPPSLPPSLPPPLPLPLFLPYNSFPFGSTS
jgi:MFS family permease